MGKTTYFYYNGLPYLHFPGRESLIPFLHFILNQHPKPQKVFFMGVSPQGMGDLSIYGLKRIHFLFQDKIYFQKLLPYLHKDDKRFLKAPAFHLLYQDGLQGILHARQTFDILFISPPPPSTFSQNRFYTVEFFQQAARNLTQQGVFVLSLESAYSLQKDSPLGKMNQIVYQTLAKVFRYIKVLPGDKSLFICSQTKGITTLSPDELGRRIARYPFSPYYKQKALSNFDLSSKEKKALFFTTLFENLIPIQHLEEVMIALRGEPLSPKNTLNPPSLPWQKKREEQKRLHTLWKAPSPSTIREWNQFLKPLCPFYYILYWNQDLEKNSTFTRALEFWKAKGKPLFILAWAVLFLCTFMVLLKKRSSLSFAMGSMFWTAFGAMGIMLYLLLYFQIFQGVLYSVLGLFLGIFMFSIALGSLGSKILSKPIGPVFGFSILVPLAIPIFLKPTLSITAYGVLLGSLGLLVGLIFRALHTLNSSYKDASFGSLVYSADIMGGFLGTFAFPLIYLSTWTLKEFCYLFALGQACFLILWYFSFRPTQ